MHANTFLPAEVHRIQSMLRTTSSGIHGTGEIGEPDDLNQPLVAA
jgi:hypothetical protein